MSVSALIGKVGVIALAGGAIASPIIVANKLKTTSTVSRGGHLLLEGLSDYNKQDCRLLTTLYGNGDEGNKYLLICKSESNPTKGIEAYLYANENQVTSLKRVDNFSFSDSNMTFKYKDSKDLSPSTETLGITQYQYWERLSGVNLEEKCSVNWQEEYKKLSCEGVTNYWVLKNLKESFGIN